MLLNFNVQWEFFFFYFAMWWYTGDHQEFSVSNNNFYRLLCCYIDVKNSNRENATEHNTNRDHGGLDQVILWKF